MEKRTFINKIRMSLYIIKKFWKQCIGVLRDFWKAGDQDFSYNCNGIILTGEDAKKFNDDYEKELDRLRWKYKRMCDDSQININLN